MYRERDIIAAEGLSDHENAASAVTAMAADYPGGSSTGEHVHNRAQLLYAIQGVMSIRSATGFWVVPPSRAVWLTAGVAHDVRMSGEVKMRTVFVDPNAAPHLPAKCCVVAVSGLLRELVLAACEVPIAYAAGSRDDRLMRLLLDELHAMPVLPLHLPFPKDERLRRICGALTDAPDRDLTARQWASGVGLTERTLQRRFLDETGLTFGQWRQQARLLFALERLAHGDRIINVALDSGYASQSAFTAMFRRHFGAPPSRFYG
jgi:AraC-like DNA-binding protein